MNEAQQFPVGTAYRFVAMGARVAIETLYQDQLAQVAGERDHHQAEAASANADLVAARQELERVYGQRDELEGQMLLVQTFLDGETPDTHPRIPGSDVTEAWRNGWVAARITLRDRLRGPAKDGGEDGVDTS